MPFSSPIRQQKYTDGTLLIAGKKTTENTANSGTQYALLFFFHAKSVDHDCPRRIWCKERLPSVFTLNVFNIRPILYLFGSAERAHPTSAVYLTPHHSGVLCSCVQILKNGRISSEAGTQRGAAMASLSERDNETAARRL